MMVSSEDDVSTFDTNADVEYDLRPQISDQQKVKITAAPHWHLPYQATRSPRSRQGMFDPDHTIADGFLHTMEIMKSLLLRKS